MYNLIIFSNKLLITVFFFMLANACTKDDYNLKTGVVQGVAKPEDTQIIFDRGDKKFKAKSGENGTYSIQNLETGIYNILFKKEGYFSYKKFGFQFFGGPAETNIIGQVELSKIPTDKIILQSVSALGYQEIEIKGTIDNEENYIHPDIPIRWFINDKQGVSHDNYLETHSYSCFVSNNLFVTTVPLDEKIFHNGSVIYITGYISMWRNDYYDWETNTQVFAIGDNVSNELELKLPVDFFNH